MFARVHALSAFVLSASLVTAMSGGCASAPADARAKGAPHMIDAHTHNVDSPESENCPVCMFYEQHKAAVVRIRNETGLGSGLVITERGHVITNAHVVGDSKVVALETSQGTIVPGRVLRRDRDADLALVVPEANDVRWSASHWDHALPPRVGSTVYIIGHPLGLGWTVTEGLISGSRAAGEIAPIELIQTNAAISPGNSGGPVFDHQGRVIGIVRSKLVQQGVENIGFAIPWSVVHTFITREPLDGAESDAPAMNTDR